MAKRKFLTVGDNHGQHEFELVDEVPQGYTVWNIGYRSNGGHMIDGYLPLCRLKQDQPFEGGRDVDIDSLKAIKVDGAEKVMDAFVRGFNTLEKMEFYAKRFRNVKNPVTQRRVAICNAAIPVMRKLNWEGEVV